MNLDIGPGSEWTTLMKEINFQKSYIKSYYFRYSHVLYRITTLEKSERFDSLPHGFIGMGLDG